MTYDQGTRNGRAAVLKEYAHESASVTQALPGARINENMNMLIRDFIRKETDFNKITRRELKRVQDLLNERPRKTLNWKSPFDVFENRNHEKMQLRQMYYFLTKCCVRS